MRVSSSCFGGCCCEGIEDKIPYDGFIRERAAGELFYFYPQLVLPSGGGLFGGIGKGPCCPDHFRRYTWYWSNRSATFSARAMRFEVTFRFIGRIVGGNFRVLCDEFFLAEQFKHQPAEVLRRQYF